jgi:hypothetical protein
MANVKSKQWFTAIVFAAFAAAGAFSLSVHTAVSAQPSLESRIQKLEDEAAIRNLLVEYGHDLDTQDYAGYSKLFAKDGTWTGGIGSAQGPEGILAMLQKAFGKDPPYDPKKVRSFHLLTNFNIQVDGDRATARSKWTYFGRSDDNKLVPRLAGHYNDTFVREGGQWKFKSRVAPRDIPNPTEDGK